ncbi:MAG: hypothetical protein RQ745_09535 [Longimicrobiales bacterium]|nr:hypothetical protein [Longimicrobiales bacterium]
MTFSSRELVERLESARRSEKRMTLFYRALAAEAEAAGRIEDAERLNGLHADEQHHLSRLTARLLELGGRPADLHGIERIPADLAVWEAAAREREAAEIAHYRGWIEEGIEDIETRAVVEEILTSERHHHRDLGGKWMPAS